MKALSQAQFLASSADPAGLPPPGPPELAFVGRSNVGKSSAINALAGRKRLAFTSKTPGRTQTINFYSLGETARLGDARTLVLLSKADKLSRTEQSATLKKIRETIDDEVRLFSSVTRHGVEE